LADPAGENFGYTNVFIRQRHIQMVTSNNRNYNRGIIKYQPIRLQYSNQIKLLLSKHISCLVRKDMDVNEHERQSNFALRHK
jgi:hypothetical protein